MSPDHLDEKWSTRHQDTRKGCVPYIVHNSPGRPLCKNLLSAVSHPVLDPLGILELPVRDNPDIYTIQSDSKPLGTPAHK
jgi:hypothetical protein